jgi:thiamine pyrophosphate-dependent acetolactate synthase large subunit-like protein
MPTTNVSSACELQLQEIADALSKSKKVVVITGAGISTNCGIPVSYTWTISKPLSL